MLVNMTLYFSLHPFVIKRSMLAAMSIIPKNLDNVHQRDTLLYVILDNLLREAAFGRAKKFDR